MRIFLNAEISKEIKLLENFWVQIAFKNKPRIKRSFEQAFKKIIYGKFFKVNYPEFQGCQECQDYLESFARLLQQSSIALARKFVFQLLLIFVSSDQSQTVNT